MKRAIKFSRGRLALQPSDTSLPVEEEDTEGNVMEDDVGEVVQVSGSEKSSGQKR